MATSKLSGWSDLILSDLGIDCRAVWVIADCRSEHRAGAQGRGPANDKLAGAMLPHLVGHMEPALTAAMRDLKIAHWTRDEAKREERAQALVRDLLERDTPRDDLVALQAALSAHLAHDGDREAPGNEGRTTPNTPISQVPLDSGEMLQHRDFRDTRPI